MLEIIAYPIPKLSTYVPKSPRCVYYFSHHLSHVSLYSPEYLFTFPPSLQKVYTSPMHESTLS